MADLFIYSNKIDSIFELLGEKENDISSSIGWAFANSSVFLKNFLKKAIGYTEDIDHEMININLQKYEKGKGFTDFEILLPGEFHLIIEAKRGWFFPTEEQMLKYASRKEFSESPVDTKKIIVLTECSQEYTNAYFTVQDIAGVEVITISWKDIYLISKETKKCTHAEKRLHYQLSKYLEKVMTMQNKDSNLVYVVVLGTGNPDGWDLGWREIVNDRKKYFHPMGKNWPTQPPNYIAFRYDGVLQSIHHIEQYEVIKNPKTIFPEAPDEEWDPPHFLYHLGPSFKPNHEVRNGKIYPNGRYWCMLDTLLTSETISEARNISQERLEEL